MTAQNGQTWRSVAAALEMDDREFPEEIWSEMRGNVEKVDLYRQQARNYRDAVDQPDRLEEAEFQFVVDETADAWMEAMEGAANVRKMMNWGKAATRVFLSGPAAKYTLQGPEMDYLGEVAERHGVRRDDVLAELGIMEYVGLKVADRMVEDELRKITIEMAPEVEKQLEDNRLNDYTPMEALEEKHGERYGEIQDYLFRSRGLPPESLRTAATFARNVYSEFRG